MEKKRRDNQSLKEDIPANKNITSLFSVMEEVHMHDQCGILTKKFRFIPDYGNGHLLCHSFDGLYIGIYDVALRQNIKACGTHVFDELELSYLIEGEQIIKIDSRDDDLIYESQESYIVYLSKVSGTICYHNSKHYKEVKIRMSPNFIKKHNLHQEYDIHEKFSLERLKKDFTDPLCTKTQEILTDILSDNRKGLLKRLFLESKVLELLSLKLDVEKKSGIEISTTDNLVKKLYEVQSIIASDLTVQYSIQQLARMARINDFTLKKEFKRIFKKTILEYTMHQRMEKAKKMLTHSKKPIYEISELVGYKNSTHFTAAFKKIEGKTPKDYRKR